MYLVAVGKQLPLKTEKSKGSETNKKGSETHFFAEGRHPMAALGGGGLAPCDAGGAGTHSWPSGCQTSHGCVPPGPPPPGCAPACTEPQHTPSAMHRTPRHCPLYVYIHTIQVWPNKGLFNSNEPFRPAHLFGHAAVNNGGLQKL